MFCIDSVNIHSIECIRDPCLVSTVLTYIVWPKSPQSQLSKTFCGLKISGIFKKLWAEMCFVSTALTYNIECITCFDLCIDSVDKQHSIHYSMHWVL